ncbi:MAG: alpha/beta fold hydrolase [Candidatus Heimdallarchaeaceae archaeon]
MQEFTSHFLPFNENHSLHYLKIGESENAIILIHGGDRKFQNAQYWTPFFHDLSNSFTVFAIDLLGHGDSISGESLAQSQRVPIETQIEVLKKFSDKVLINYEKKIWVGRSYGANVVLHFTNKYPEVVTHLSLIAPAVSSTFVENLSDTVKNKPLMLFWAENDPIVPFANNHSFLKHFSDCKLVSAGTITCYETEKWRAHTPEMEKKDLFLSSFLAFPR